MRNRVIMRRQAAGVVSRGDTPRGRGLAVIVRECTCDDKGKGEHPPDEEEDRGAGVAGCLLFGGDDCS
jgi:hypothetical protein